MPSRCASRDALVSAQWNGSPRRRLERRLSYSTFANPGWRLLEQFPIETRVDPLSHVLEGSRIALVATPGAHLRDEPPFELGAGGDDSYRELPADAREISFAHVGYDTHRALAEPDVVFPLSLLRAFAAEGTIGELAPRAFSFMGYIPETNGLLTKAGPEVATKLLADAVDLVLLVPS